MQTLEAKDISEHVAKTTADGFDIFIFDDGSVLILGDPDTCASFDSVALATRWASAFRKDTLLAWLHRHIAFTGIGSET
jgi:hypothetical protein